MPFSGGGRNPPRPDPGGRIREFLEACGASHKQLSFIIIIGRRATAGELEGDGVVPLRGSAEQSRAPRGKLDFPWKCPVYVEDFSKEFTRRDTS